MTSETRPSSRVSMSLNDRPSRSAFLMSRSGVPAVSGPSRMGSSRGAEVVAWRGWGMGSLDASAAAQRRSRSSASRSCDQFRPRLCHHEPTSQPKRALRNPGVVGSRSAANPPEKCIPVSRRKDFHSNVHTPGQPLILGPGMSVPAGTIPFMSNSRPTHRDGPPRQGLHRPRM